MDWWEERAYYKFKCSPLNGETETKVERERELMDTGSLWKHRETDFFSVWAWEGPCAEKGSYSAPSQASYVLPIYLQQEFVHHAIVLVMQRGWRFRRWKNSGTSTSYFCSPRRSSMRQDVLRFAISHARFFFSLLFLSVWRGCLRFRLEVQKDSLIAYTLMNNIAAAFPAKLNHDLL